MADYDRKDLEEKVFCAKCNSLVEETLLLTCEHNLCVPCAARNLYKEDQKNIHKFKTVVCEICLNQTVLDPSTANELLAMFPQYSSNYTQSSHTLNKSPKSRRDTPERRNYVQHNVQSIISTTQNQMNVNTNSLNESLLNLSVYSKGQNTNLSTIVNSKRELCKEHGEELTYYCLDCQCRCICSECVVHGIHKNHEVMNVKRAYPFVVEKTEDLMFQVQNRIQELSNVQFSIDNKKKELVDSTNLLKQEMSSAFEEIKMRLQKKEKEIMEKADLFLQEHLQELSTYSRVLQSKIISFNKLIDGINSNVTRKDEINLLNFYSENKNRILGNIESEIPEIPDFNSIYNMKVNINQSSFEGMINNLNALHMEITSMKGFEVSKLQQNTQKFAIKRDLYGAKSVQNNPNLSSINSGLSMNLGYNKQNVGGPIGPHYSPSHNSSYDYSRANQMVSKVQPKEF
jgi:hypothetical protein